MQAKQSDMIGTEVRNAYINAKNSITQYNRALMWGDDDEVEQAEGTLHLAVVNLFVHLRPWLQTQAYLWRGKRVMRKPDLEEHVDDAEEYDEKGEEEDTRAEGDADEDEGWVTGLSNLDKWVMSVRREPKRAEDAVEGESEEYEEVAQVMPPACALQASRALDAAFQQSPWAPRSMSTMSAGQIGHDDVYGEDDAIPDAVESQNEIQTGASRRRKR